MKRVAPFHVVPAIIVSAFMLLTACSKDNGSSAGTASSQSAAPAASQSGDEELKDIASYHLTMDKIDKYIAAERNLAAKAKSMSPEERKAFEERGDQDSENDASLDDMVKKFDSEPVLKSAIQEAGLSTREFVMLTMSMMQSGMAAAVLKMRPNDNQDSLIRSMQANPENVKFYQEHEAEITQKQKAIEAELKAAGMGS